MRITINTRSGTVSYSEPWLSRPTIAVEIVNANGDTFTADQDYVLAIMSGNTAVATTDDENRKSSTERSVRLAAVSVRRTTSGTRARSAWV